jgi:hypothetical protein
MPGCARLSAFALLGLLAAVPAARAGSAADEAARWGLLGSWKLDCDAPPSVEDGELRYLVKQGTLFHERELGSGKDVNRVVSAKTRSDGALDLVVEFAPYRRRREYVIEKGDDGRVRTISNRDVTTNQFSVKNGKFTRNGHNTQWQTHCRPGDDAAGGHSAD